MKFRVGTKPAGVKVHKLSPNGLQFSCDPKIDPRVFPFYDNVDGFKEEHGSVAKHRWWSRVSCNKCLEKLQEKK